MRKQGWYWPWLILAGTLGIIWMSVYTVIFALDNPVQLSNDHIKTYKGVNKDFDKMTYANIDFKKSYDLVYLPKAMPKDGTQISYKIMTKAGVPVSNAKFEALLTRPNSLAYDKVLELESEKEGVYNFKKVTLPLMGRWDLFANVTIGDKKGFLRLRLDTRYPMDVLPFGTALPMN